MRRNSEPFAQLGFLLRPAGGDLLAEHPDPHRQPVEPVLEPVDGQRLGSTATADHHVDPGPGPGDEPEAARHAADSSGSVIGSLIAARWRAAHSRRTSLSSVRRCLRERLTSWRTWNRIRWRVSGSSARRRTRKNDADSTTV